MVRCRIEELVTERGEWLAGIDQILYFHVKSTTICHLKTTQATEELLDRMALADIIVLGISTQLVGALLVFWGSTNGHSIVMWPRDDPSVHSFARRHNSSKEAACDICLISFDKHTHNEQLNLIYLHVIKDLRGVLQLPAESPSSSSAGSSESDDFPLLICFWRWWTVRREGAPKAHFWTNKFPSSLLLMKRKRISLQINIQCCSFLYSQKFKPHDPHHHLWQTTTLKISSLVWSIIISHVCRGMSHTWCQFNYAQSVLVNAKVDDKVILACISF